ncbi:hypothetical protein CRENBAI_006008 [Crenichthys baileyi]|uniref:Uncharacterized protein n=1 Tax=Crenichthys baileyi TaxID=28760 RepID=A0AAV9QX32_9TELE
MISIIVKEMMKACASLSRRASTEIARRLVAMYPNSRQDVIEGDVVGQYHSLVKQIQARIENGERSSSAMIQKCKKEDQMTQMNETSESQQENQKQMKILSEQTSFVPEEVKNLMKCTSYSQRKAVNKGADLQILIEEWPFLFQEIGMTVHFEELTVVPLKQTFLTCLEKKAKRLETTCADKSKRVLEAVVKLRMHRGQLERSSEDVKDLMLLLS